MASLVQSGKYGVINTDDTTTNGFYVIQFISEAYTLQNNTQIDGEVILLVNYLSRYNIFDPWNKILIGIGNNSHCNRIS